MPKERKGFIVKKQGKLYARICYTNEQGKSRELMRRAVDREDARRILKQLNEELDQLPERRKTSLDSARMTFAELAELYKQAKIKPAEYHGNDRKIGGMRSYKSALSFLKALVEFFGKQRIRDINSADLESYKLLRLRTPTKRGERSITSVNKELGCLRAALNWAKRRGFLTANPFDNAEAIILPADEKKRDRLISKEEEEKLLSVCVGKREHLRACIIAATDTGLRKNEMLTLKWEDIFLSERLISLKAFNSKTAKARVVPITERLAKELQQLRKDAPDDALVFQCGDIKRSFATACRLAGLQDLHWHDLRHVFASRLASENLPISIVSGLLGHSSPQTTARYLNTKREDLTRAAEVMNRLHSQHTE